ncbi:nucleotide binding protein [Cryphonectria parasitica EP155]|uniref:Peroxisomal ATPase PEX1 n=1 Tax=Cryphonectria parasitica (strain ATCC 38755 / EP155) TaxID=660469 RepID=A0A9P4XXG9_CRYP1|nr:nucleotide binding protein [Cryphonectria parasitica EP155]KAF3762565.1 nucleotide binding protein [Cryphonectria parasitica EP155]
MSQRKPTPAEVSLVHLKNCLVNLPSSLVSLLVNVNTPVQNVIVELNYRDTAADKAAGAPPQRSVYLGWTGMPSKRKLASIVGRDGLGSSSRGGTGLREQEVALVEIDPTLASTLGLEEGQKVMATIHTDPPLAHTVNIEPLTPEDWEIIELHATFLELNLLSQMRALPNPAYAPAPGTVVGPHPLTLHLSPTSTANIKILSLDPPQPSDVPFAKIAPDAEVIVAPKVKPKSSRGTRENRSVASTSRKSGKSSTSTVRRRSQREDRKPALFLRGVDRKLCDDWFDDGAGTEELSIWVDRELLVSNELRGLKWAAVNVMRPAGLQEPGPVHGQQPDGQTSAESLKPGRKIVAQLLPWDDPPNGQTAALSTLLCSAFGSEGLVGGVVKIEPATPPLAKKSILKSDGDEDRPSVQHLKLFPFISDGSAAQTSGLKFGGESKSEREETVKKIKHIYSGKSGKGLFDGPLTDGLVLGTYEGLDQPSNWTGGVIKFHPASASQSSTKDSLHWVLGSDWQLPIEVQPPIARPSSLSASDISTNLGVENPLVGIDSLLQELQSHLSQLSSVLLTGALGSGKTSVAQSVARFLRKDQLVHTTYFSCRTLVNDESRVSTIRETLNRLFLTASWGARLGGKALVILDDLDRLCPVETELQVGNENGRSRHISEAICSIVHQYCGQDSNVALLATAQGKESLHNVLVGGHLVREIVPLRAPDKPARRTIMEAITLQNAVLEQEDSLSTHDGSRPTTADGSATGDENAWMDGASPRPRAEVLAKPSGFVLQADLDLLDIAGETDGYMPGDLSLLVSRARNEAIMRSLIETSSDTDIRGVPLGRVDFENALKGFTPASLRNVTLQSSTTTFDSIGGLTETRQVLLETLQYPTKYAPIFAQCPLRLRSGILLYGYPGCGKTLLASAVAGECGLNFISVKGPEILNKYIGASEKSVRDLFERAQAAKPCVLFFDEFDSIAPKRGHDSTGVTDRVVNQLLTLMDGAEGLSGVYVLAATSRPDLIDPALLRPGRLDKSILCDFPNLEERVDIIRAIGRKAKLSEAVLQSDEDLVEIAKRTDGFSGADLQALVSNAQLEAIQDVLKETDHVGGGAGSTRRPGQKSGAGKTTGPSAHNFVQFRYGEDGAGEDQAQRGSNRSSELAQQAMIAAKLESIRLSRKRAKQQRGGVSAPTDSDEAKVNGKDSQQKEVGIQWRHLVKALGGTRTSISREQRALLQRIYREFVVGRSGEMRDGQASMEIGGRSSLM